MFQTRTIGLTGRESLTELQFPESVYLELTRRFRSALTLADTEVIPKFINLLQRKKPLYIHGNGQNTRRYLHAGDAADAFDTILHKGEIGQIYNVDSRDEISNLDLAAKLCKAFGVEDIEGSIQYTRDRPFNDLRYAVDGSKLRALGWQPRVSFEDGLSQCIDWYRKYSNWWGDIDSILTPFPEVKQNASGPAASVLVSHEAVLDERTLQAGVGAEPYDPASAGKELLNGSNVPNGKTNGAKKLKRKANTLDED